MSTFIGDWEDEIVEGLLVEFEEPKPKIIADFNFNAGEGEKKLYERASLLANQMNAGTSVFVGFTGTSIGEKKAGVYFPYWKFAVLIFAKDRRKTTTAHKDIYETLEIILLKLWKMGYHIESIRNAPVRISTTGLYRAELEISKKKSYPSNLTKGV